MLCGSLVAVNVRSNVHHNKLVKRKGVNLFRSSEEPTVAGHTYSCSDAVHHPVVGGHQAQGGRLSSRCHESNLNPLSVYVVM